MPTDSPNAWPYEWGRVSPGTALLPAAAADRELLLAVQALDELVVDHEALPTQQFVQPPVAEASSLAGKSAQALAQPFMIARPLRLALDQRARDPDQPAGTTA
jgi:hypothetical protein